MEFKNNTVYFDKDFLSPFYMTHFFYPNKETPLLFCNCSEQCFQAVKALMFKDYDALKSIMESKSAADLYTNGHEVVNYDKESWNRIKYDVMLNIELEKYKQNDALRKELLSKKFDDKTFAYCNVIDKYWGIGIGLYNVDKYNSKAWTGENNYGKILNTVRNILKT